jgi:ribonuclease HI
MVLRGEDSYFVGATTKVLKGSDDATLAESMGICEALLWIETLRRDAEGIVKALEKNKFPRTNWGLTVNRISRDLVNLDHVSVKWVNRKGNQAAHDLARFAFVEPNKT